MTTIPPPVRQMLIDAGKLDPDRTTRRAHLRPCKRCRAWTVTGLDNEPAGLPAVADPVHVEAGAELVALLAGRATYDLIPGEVRTGMSLQYRCPSRIAASRGQPVLADHECGRALVPDLAVVRAVLARTVSLEPSEPSDSEEVPF